ncbi:MAG: acetyl-CoA C-acyltransferase [Gammaproteobacteria bacterium]|nr:acetyl-CoA C-acyltransferase [Gammaproteobacteria bacterium]
MENSSVVVTGLARTPIGGFQGRLSPLTAPQLGSASIRAALEDSDISGSDVDEVLMGCVLSAGIGQAPARQAALDAGIPKSVGCTTVNKMCGSGMKTVMLGYDSIVAGTNSIVVTGGLESMSNAPYILPKARGGYRMGHSQVLDHMFADGLEDAYQKGALMGEFAEDCAESYQFSREAQDEFAIESLTRAQKATQSGTFAREITPVQVSTRKETYEVTNDEQPEITNSEKIPFLRPAFRKNGSVTAANSSSISDGGATVVLMSEAEAQRRDKPIQARLVGHTTFAAEPNLFPTAPISAIRKLLDKLNWSVDDIDLFEVNEAFAVVTMAAMHSLKIPHDRMNIHGGACALGHPVGASGTRILVTLIAAMERYDLKRGVASLCIGGGEATAIGVVRS